MAEYLKQPIIDLIAERDELLLRVEQLRAEALAWHNQVIQLRAQLAALQVDSTTNPYANEED